MDLLNKILDFEKGDTFYRFGNADGKRWIVPAKNMSVALCLYQPSGIKGKLLKSLLPNLHGFTPVRRTIKAERVCCSLKKELSEVLDNIFGEEIEFSIFEGTPSVHKKPVIQLSHGGHISGYCKVSDKKEIAALFDKECEMLHRLAKRGIKNIPKVLYRGTLTCGVDIFVQSTQKTTHSETVHEWGALQEEFLATMHERTKHAVLFEESDFHRSLSTLLENADRLPCTTDRSLVIAATERILAKYRDEKVVFSAYHGDFTPWNMTVEKGRLFVFDFEYAAMSYPPGMDKCHFLLQTAFFEQRLSPEEAVRVCTADGKEPAAMYAIDIMSRYIAREKGAVSNETARMFAFCNEIVKQYIE